MKTTGPFDGQRAARQYERNAELRSEIVEASILARHGDEPSNLSGALRAGLKEAGYTIDHARRDCQMYSQPDMLDELQFELTRELV